jgi:hypothetical protein
MTEERELGTMPAPEAATERRGPEPVRASIQRRQAESWVPVQDGALFDGAVVMTDLSDGLVELLHALASCPAEDGLLSVLIGPPDTRGRAPADYERIGVRTVTALRAAAGEYGDAHGVARLDLERPSVHRGIVCAGIDVPVLMPGVAGDGAPAAPARRLVGTPYLHRLAAVLVERDGDDRMAAGLRGPNAETGLRGANDGHDGHDRWTTVADGLAHENARTAIHPIDLSNLDTPRFGIGNFVCMVFACC